MRRGGFPQPLKTKLILLVPTGNPRRPCWPVLTLVKRTKNDDEADRPVKRHGPDEAAVLFPLLPGVTERSYEKAKRIFDDQNPPFCRLNGRRSRPPLRRLPRLSQMKGRIMSTEYEKCLAGVPFVGGKDPDLLRMIRRARKLLRQLNDVEYDDAGEKEHLMRELFGHVGKGVHLEIDFHCELGRHIFIGDNVVINMNCTFITTTASTSGTTSSSLPTCRSIRGRTRRVLPNGSSPAPFRRTSSPSAIPAA